ncbi:MAG: hypothetical protein ACOX19_03020 [Fermentimonas sp.]
MKKITAFAFILLLLTSCGTKKIINKEVRTNYTNVTFSPKIDDKVLGESFNLSIEPVDAKGINKEVIETVMRDGGYEKRFTTSVEFYVKDKKLTKYQQRLLNKTQKAFDFINNMADKRQISQYVQSALLEKVYYCYFLEKDYGYDGSELELASGDFFATDLNPYKINDRYLSLFRFTFNNNGKEIQDVEIENFQISDNNEQLYPFKNEYFEKIWENDAEKMKYIYRMNMPNKLTVTPSQKVIKYISTPAINPSSKNITVSYIKDNVVINYPFELKVETIENTMIYSLFDVSLKSKKIKQEDLALYVVDLGNNDVFPLKSNKVYLLNKDINRTIKIHTFIIPYRGNKFKYFESELLNGSLKEVFSNK